MAYHSASWQNLSSRAIRIKGDLYLSWNCNLRGCRPGNDRDGLPRRYIYTYSTSQIRSRINRGKRSGSFVLLWQFEPVTINHSTQIGDSRPSSKFSFDDHLRPPIFRLNSILRPSVFYSCDRTVCHGDCRYMSNRGDADISISAAQKIHVFYLGGATFQNVSVTKFLSYSGNLAEPGASTMGYALPYEARSSLVV